MQATVTFVVGSETATVVLPYESETVVEIDVPTDGTDATAALQAALNALPNGTESDPTIGLLPSGVITLTSQLTPTVGLQLANKTWVELRGQDTTLYWPGYGPQSNGLWQRRHLVCSGLNHVTFRGIRIAGAHTARTANPALAPYLADYAFQHAFQISNSADVKFFDCSAFEVAGDGLYLSSVDDLVVDGFRVEFNGRHGIAGIDGNRWLFDHLNLLGCTRAAIDWEPIGNLPSGAIRWVHDVEVRNSTLNGSFGVILQRCSAQWIHHNDLPSGVRLENNSAQLRELRTATIEDNDFKTWNTTTNSWSCVQAGSFDELIVKRNTVNRIATHEPSAGSRLVRLTDPDLAQASIVVRDNTATNFISALRAEFGSPPVNPDVVVPANTWDVGNNDLGGVVEEEPDWLASRLGV